MKLRIDEEKVKAAAEKYPEAAGVLQTVFLEANLTAEQAQAIINRLAKEKKGHTGLKKKTHTFSVVLTEQDYEELRDMAYELGDATAVLARKFVLKGIREMRRKQDG